MLSYLTDFLFVVKVEPDFFSDGEEVKTYMSAVWISCCFNNDVRLDKHTCSSLLRFLAVATVRP